ncbi:MAG: hypothetical protein WCY41_01200 [Candidatus Micrarchaeia archaeon]
MSRFETTLFVKRTTFGSNKWFSRLVSKNVDCLSERIILTLVKKTGAGKPEIVDMENSAAVARAGGKIAMATVNDPMAMKSLLEYKETIGKNFNTLVIGGQLVSLVPSAFRKAFPEANLCVGEGEEQMGEIIADADSGVKGKLYHAAPVDIKKNYIIAEREGRYLFNSVELGRGCTYSCGFCGLPPSFKRVRTRDPEQVKEELDRLGRGFLFVDPNLSAYPNEYLYDIFSYMEKSGKYWGGEGSAAELAGEKKELWNLMSRTNISVLNGVESLVCGGRWNGKNRHGLLAPNGSVVVSSLIVGAPGQTAQDVMWTAKECRSKNLTCVIHLYSPYPGTADYAKAREEGRVLVDDFYSFDRRHVVIKQDGIAPGETQRLFYDFTRKAHSFSGTMKEAIRIIKETDGLRLALLRVLAMISVRMKNTTRIVGKEYLKSDGQPNVPLTLFE